MNVVTAVTHTEKTSFRKKNQYCVAFAHKRYVGEWSGGQISCYQNLTFSWGQNYDHEIKS